jgi:ABC-type multidrug transport system ATPase subunit
MDEVGLSAADRRPVRAYSQGMRQRLGLAAALLRRPPLLILDEPSNGLDPQGIQEIRRVLLHLNYKGTTIFLSSHLLAEIEQMCTHIGVLHSGRFDAPGATGHLAATDWSGRGTYSRYPTMRCSARKFGSEGRRRPAARAVGGTGRAERLPGQ